jgi:hypothetical protein
MLEDCARSSIDEDANRSTNDRVPGYADYSANCHTISCLDGFWPITGEREGQLEFVRPIN